jgi:hypothetical protein
MYVVTKRVSLEVVRHVLFIEEHYGFPGYIDNLGFSSVFAVHVHYNGVLYVNGLDTVLTIKNLMWLVNSMLFNLNDFATPQIVASVEQSVCRVDWHFFALAGP